MFERSTKTRQTLDLLGNVYRNSKWTDFKVQNIKSFHLFTFNRVSFFLIMSVLSAYFLLFRFDMSSPNVFLNNINQLYLVISDFTSYAFSVVSMYFIAAYLYLSKLFSKLMYLNLSNSKTISNYRANIKTRNQKRVIIKPSVSLNNRIKVRLNPELLLLKEMFSLKRSLDSKAEHSSFSNLDSLKLRTDSNYCLLEKWGSQAFEGAATPITNLESSYLHANSFKSKFIKSNLSELDTSLSSVDMHTSLLLEKSIESSFMSANSSRWLIKMSPISEYLSVNNNYATNLKYSIGSPVTNSQLINNNIWLSNIDNVSTNNLSEANIPFLNNFEYSRLWNQKRNFFTLLPKLSATKQKDSIILNTAKPISQYDYKLLLLGLNLNYLGLKDGLLINTNWDLIDTALKDKHFIHNSTSSLNLWGTLDSYHVISLCSNSNTNGHQDYYDYNTTKLNYKNL